MQLFIVSIRFGPLAPWVRDRKGAFTLVELLVAVTVVAVLVSISLGVLNQTRTATNRAVCVMNLRQLSVGVVSYTSENNGMFPSPFGDAATASWDGLILPYMVQNRKGLNPLKTLQCPEDKRPSVIDAVKAEFPRSYMLSSQPANNPSSPMGVVGYYDDGTGNNIPVQRRLTQIAAPVDTVMIWECFTASGTTTPGYINNWQFHSGNSVGSGWNSGPRITGYRADGSKKLYHDSLLNFAMCDGHVESRDLKWPFSPTNHWNALR